MTRILGSRSSSDVVSFAPMPFGTEDDFALCLTELKWLREKNGRLADIDFETLAKKYNFPTGLLKEGLEGLKWPDSMLISKSEWYTVLYAWITQERAYALDLLKLRIDYYHRMGISTLLLAFVALVAGDAVALAYYLFHPDSFQLLGMILAFVLALVGFFISAWFATTDRKTRVEELTLKLRRLGLEHLLTTVETVLARRMLFVFFSPTLLVKGFEEAPLIHVVVGSDGRSYREDADAEYRKRISDLTGSR